MIYSESVLSVGRLVNDPDKSVAEATFSPERRVSDPPYKINVGRLAEATSRFNWRVSDPPYNGSN